MNSKLTIVLTLKDRSLFTKRWMNYMNDICCQHRILIADGGKDRDIEEDLRDHGNYENLDYEYIRYPYDSCWEDYYKKLDDAISQVKTPYILLADNDDFFLLDRVSEILDALDNDKDIVGARGTHVNFTVYDVNQQENNNVNGTHYLAITNEVPSINANTSVERIEELCGNMSRYDYYMNWYCVFRTEAVKTAWENILDIKVKEPVFVEIFLGIFLVERGKIVVLPFDFCLRQSGTSQTGGYAIVKENDFLERCISVDAFSDFKTLVEKFLVSLNENQKDRLFKAIAGWLQVFIINVYIGNVRIYRLRRFNAFLRYVKRLPRIGYFATAIYLYSFSFFSGFRKKRIIKIKKIENHILR